MLKVVVKGLGFNVNESVLAKEKKIILNKKMKVKERREFL